MLTYVLTTLLAYMYRMKTLDPDHQNNWRTSPTPGIEATVQLSYPPKVTRLGKPHESRFDNCGTILGSLTVPLFRWGLYSSSLAIQGPGPGYQLVW